MNIIKIDEIVKYYMLHSQTNWDDKDFPNVAPPFQDFVIEFTMPPKVQIDGVMYDNPFHRSHWNSEWHTQKVIKNEIEGWMMQSMIASTELKMKFEARLFCSLLGVLQPVFQIDNQMTSVELNLFTNTLRQQDVQGLSDIATMLLQPQLLALSFMHCKNVSKELVDPMQKMKSKVRKHWLKKGKKALKPYYVLNIEPLKQVLKSEGKSDTVGLQKALHICRGHFRDCTEGKGLFGKYHGLFWIESHVKGSKDDGVVNKIYNVKV
jgi:hypothetical protein